MFFKWLMCLHIIFYFDLVCAVPDFESAFKSLVPYSTDYILNISPLKWAGACEYVIQILQFEMNFEKQLHIHYKLFSNSYISNSNAVLQLSNETITLNIMPCHALLSPVIPSSESIESYMYDDIGISIFKTDFLVIFSRRRDWEKNSTYLYYQILTIYQSFTIFTLHPVHVNIVMSELMRSQKLSYILDEGTDYKDVVGPIYNFGKVENDHILETPDIGIFIKMCTWFYGQQRYSRMFTVSSNPKDYKNGVPGYESLKLLLRKNLESTWIMLKGKPCFGTLQNGVVTTDFKLLQGSSSNSVILARKIGEENTIQLIEPLELVYNVDKFY